MAGESLLGRSITLTSIPESILFVEDQSLKLESVAAIGN